MFLMIHIVKVRWYLKDSKTICAYLVLNFFQYICLCIENVCKKKNVLKMLNDYIEKIGKTVPTKIKNRKNYF